MTDIDDTAESDEGHEDHEEHPRGSLLLLSLYMLLIAAMWIWAYVLLIGRS